jgi:hypothetical protein
MIDPPPPSSSRGLRIACGVLLFLHFALGLHTALSKTITHDEIWHLPVGILTARTGEFQHDNLNPPLSRLWAAIPAVVAGVEVESGRDATDIALKFVLSNPDHRRWYLWGRAFNLLLSVATAALLMKWAAEWYGPAAGFLAGALYFAEPNVLAHASLVTPDASATLGFVATLYLLDRWLRTRSWPAAVGLGLVLGLAQATKFTAVILYPVVILAWVCGRWWPSPTEMRTAARWAQLPTLLLVSLIPWNAAFLARGTGTPLAEYALQSTALKAVRDGIGPLARVPLPLPRDYVEGLDRQRMVMEQPHPSFLNDAWRVTGFRDYYLRTLQYKLPHFVQGCVLLGLLGLLWPRGLRPRGPQCFLVLLPTALLLGIASGSSMQLGVRYVLPVLPLLMLAGSSVAAGWVSGRGAGVAARIVGVVIVIAGCGWSLRHHPHHLAYFNERAGGPVGGRHHLLDSNLDWGQDLHLVRQYIDEHHLGRIHLVYFGTLPAEVLGIEYEISPGRRPEPGWHFVSVNYVMGRPHLLREPDGTSRPADLEEFGYFQRYEPVARLGYSIDVYEIRP